MPPDGCSLDYDGGPGMAEPGPFGDESGRSFVPLATVESFHVLRARQTGDEAQR